MALIEIDGLPNLKMVDLSMAMLVIARGYFSGHGATVSTICATRNAVGIFH